MKRLNEATPIVIAIVGFALILGMRIAPSQTPKTFSLRYDMASDSGFTMTLDRKHRNQRDFLGNELVTIASDRVACDALVKKAGPDGLVIEIEYKSRVHETDDPNHPAGPDFRALIGKRVQALLTARGEAKDLQGFDRLPQVEIPDQEMRLKATHYRNELRDFFPALPSEPVALGESWTCVREFGEPIQGGDVRVIETYEYTLAAITRQDGHDCLEIDGTVKIAVTGRGETDGLRFDIDLKGEGTEKIYFAWRKGMFLSRERKTTTRGKAQDKAVGLTIPMKHDFETTNVVRFD